MGIGPFSYSALKHLPIWGGGCTNFNPVTITRHLLVEGVISIFSGIIKNFLVICNALFSCLEPAFLHCPCSPFRRRFWSQHVRPCDLFEDDSNLPGSWEEASFS